ncbi:MAG: PQ-loop repeat-containing protein [Mycoplasma sp.]|nr:PQ-loop repeat-containing protein [Mycoplasma sp.]
MNNLLIILILGMIILVVSFTFQIIKVWNEKHSHGLSLTSWTINMLGRVIWVIYGMLLSTGGGIVLTIGQGLCAMMSIPVIYYILRNRKNEGRYKKEDFNKYLFAWRVLMLVVLLTLIIICVVFSIMSINQNSKISEEKTIFTISLIGSSFTGFAFLPQTIKTLKTQNTKSTSLNLCLAFIVGNILMISYLSIQAFNVSPMKYIPAISFTSFSVLLIIVIVIIKIKNIIKNKD